MCVNFSVFLLLKYNENNVLFSKITQNKVKGPFFLTKCLFCYAMLGGCPYLLNKTLDKVYSDR